MDWTGGTRRRYANKGRGAGATAQKQKAHFAKARAAAAQSNAPFVPDFMHNAITSKQYQPPMTSSQHPGFNSRGRASESHGKTSGSDRSTVHRQPRSEKKRHAEKQRSGNSTVSMSAGHRNPAASQRKQQVLPMGLDFPANMTEEETLLLANRRRLLARNDWLGLAASRPEKYRFPSHRDKDRIGKRRKVDKSRTHRLQEAEQRPLSPLFRQREPLMSGTLQNEDIQIKIGTDAFASQTQNTRQSVTPANTSMRPPSTDLAPLTEESMLLDVDENGFAMEDDDWARTTVREAPTRSPDTRDGIVAQDSWLRGRTPFYTESRADDAAYVAAYAEPDDTALYRGDEFDSFANADSQHQAQTVWSQTVRSQSQAPEAFNEIDLGVANGNFRLDHPRYDTFEQLSEHAESEDDDEFFHKLQQLGQNGPDMTLTGQSRTPAMPITHPSVWSTVPQPTEMSTALNPGLTEHDSAIQELVAEDYAPSQSDSEELLDDHEPAIDTRIDMNPPRPAFKAADIVTTLPQSMPENDQGSNNDGDIWKKIVFGDTDSEPSDTESRRRIWHHSDTIAPLEAASPKVVIEDSYSDKATVGNSIFHHRTLTSDHTSSTASAHGPARPSATSMIGHANTAPYENEDGQDLHSDRDLSITTGNIHAASTSTTNPYRFKKTKNTKLPPAQKVSRFLPAPRSKHVESRSVYDLAEDD